MRVLKAVVAFLPTLLRLLLGVMFLMSGWTWFHHPEADPRLGHAVNDAIESGRVFAFYAPFLRSVVLPNLGVFTALVGFGEMMCGISIGFGAATRLGAAGVAFLFLNYGLLNGWGSMLSHAMQMAVVLIPVVFNSGRRFGVDRWLHERWPDARIW